MVKAKADTHISCDQGPELPHQLQYEPITYELSDGIEEVSPIVNISNQNQWSDPHGRLVFQEPFTSMGRT